MCMTCKLSASYISSWRWKKFKDCTSSFARNSARGRNVSGLSLLIRGIIGGCHCQSPYEWPLLLLLVPVMMFLWCSLLHRRGLYRGWFPVITSLWCSNFVYFYSYNFLKLLLYGDSKPGPIQDLSAASIAGKYAYDHTCTFLWLPWVGNQLYCDGRWFALLILGWRSNENLFYLSP